MNQKIKISVIIPCYNAEKWIEETLESVYSQQGSFELEVIVINDGSTDNSEKIINDTFPEVLLTTTVNQGASKARNLGTTLSTGDYIQYLDADDILAENKIQLQVDLLSETNSDIAYGNWQHYIQNEQGTFHKELIINKRIENPEIDLFSNFWCPPAVYLFNKKIVEKVGAWREDLPIIQDARFVLDCALNGAEFCHLDEVVAYYRRFKSESLSKNQKKFIWDCFNNALDIEKIWNNQGPLSQEKYEALNGCFEFVTRVSYSEDKKLYKLAYEKLLEYGINDSLIKKNASENFYLLKSMFGYKPALFIHTLYGKCKRLIH